MISGRISHFRIVSKLGEGGMGAVYRAEDLDMDCDRALKFLREGALEDRVQRARLLREARAAASLTHPAICTIHEIDEDEGQPFIVMEYVEGQTLRERLSQGPLPLEEALNAAVQIAEGLEVAHAKGIVHRDLKPSNVMITQQGHAKIMDFGLAQLPDVTQITRTGQIAGTVSYMSPEQSRGEPVDARTDIWSFGVVLHEMVTGQRPFRGPTEAAVVHAIQTQDPEPPSSAREGMPPQLDFMIRQALAKDFEQRYQSIGALLHDLRTLQGLVQSSEKSASPQWEFDLPTHKILVSAAVLAIVVAVSVLTWTWATRPTDEIPASAPRQVTRLEAWEGDPALSPDGTHIAYAVEVDGNTDLYLVDALGGDSIRLTDHEAVDARPAWFPDGRSLAFVSDRDGTVSIWKIGRLGGTATLLMPRANDPAISPDGRQIAFVRRLGEAMERIGVAPVDDPTQARILTDTDDGLWSHRHPAWSPDGTTLCYSAWEGLWTVPAAGGPARPLGEQGSAMSEPVWSPSGRHIYFASFTDGPLALWRIRADGREPTRLTLGTGPESQPTLSQTGQRLAYSTSADVSEVVIVDREQLRTIALPGPGFDDLPTISQDGKRIVFVSDRWQSKYELFSVDILPGPELGPARRLTDQRGDATHPALSPDGRWIAYYRIVGEERDIWIVPSESGQPLRFTEDPAADIHPTWSPDGTHLAFVSERAGSPDLWVSTVIEGRRSGEPRRLTRGEPRVGFPAWSPDGKDIAFVGYQENQREVWIALADGSEPPRAITRGALARRVRWGSDSTSLWVSGWHDEEVSLKRICTTEGTPSEVVPCQWGIPARAGLFDISSDEKTIVHTRVRRVGDIWVLTAQSGSF